MESREIPKFDKTEGKTKPNYPTTEDIISFNRIQNKLKKLLVS